MTLPDLPTPKRIPTHGYQTVAAYTESQMLAHRAAVIEACAQVLLESGFRSTGIPAYESLAEKLRNMK